MIASIAIAATLDDKGMMAFLGFAFGLPVNLGMPLENLFRPIQKLLEIHTMGSAIPLLLQLSIELILNENVFYTWLAVLAGAVGGG